MSMSEINNLNMSLNEIRSLVLEVFKKQSSSQYLIVCNDVAELAVKKGIVPDVGQGVFMHVGGRYTLTDKDQDKVREIIWNLVIEGVLTIGSNASNPAWPFMKITEYGYQVINSDIPVPHDPSGYFSRLKTDVPNVDELIITYLNESLMSYRIDLKLSSTIMLGCASEKALLLLIDSYINSIQDEAKRKVVYDKFKNKMIKRQFDEFIRAMTTIKEQIPKEIEDGLNNVLFGIFEMIRNYRNDAGHPTGITISKEQVFANIQVFIPYLKKVYQLKEYFENIQKQVF